MILEKLLAAIEANTAALLGAKGETPIKPTRASKAAEAGNAAIAAASGSAVGPVVTPAPAAAPAAPTLSMQELVPFVKDAGKKDGEKAKAILAKYGAPKLSELKPETYPALLEDLKAFLAPAPVAAAPGSDLV